MSAGTGIWVEWQVTAKPSGFRAILDTLPLRLEIKQALESSTKYSAA
jgi:hypothetical protein